MLNQNVSTEKIILININVFLLIKFYLINNIIISNNIYAFIWQNIYSLTISNLLNNFIAYTCFVARCRTFNIENQRCSFLFIQTRKKIYANCTIHTNWTSPKAPRPITLILEKSSTFNLLSFTLATGFSSKIVPQLHNPVVIQNMQMTLQSISSKCLNYRHISNCPVTIFLNSKIKLKCCSYYSCQMWNLFIVSRKTFLKVKTHVCR